MPDAVSRLLRSVLPRGVDIPVLPGVGITGYGPAAVTGAGGSAGTHPRSRRPTAAVAERLRDRGYGAQAG